jgi:hypothetical protein
MKSIKGLLALAYIVLFSTHLDAQNPNWTIPDSRFELSSTTLSPLPIPDPTETDQRKSYIGQRATNTHAAYSDKDGNLLFFTVDEFYYDANGYGILEAVRPGGIPLSGYNERLILPMGDDCRRYAILYPNVVSASYLTSRLMAFFMTIYDLDLNSAYSTNAIGGIVGSPLGENGTPFTEISERDGDLYGTYTTPIFGNEGNGASAFNYGNFPQVAATGLIDGCFYYVYVFEGQNILRYKLTENDLEWDNYVFTLPTASTNGCVIRSEMELIELPNGDYRIAFPTCSGGETGITIYDVDGTTGNLIPSTEKNIDLGEDSALQNAYPAGVEFNGNGDYLYITHTPNLDLPNALDVYDVANSAFLTGLPTLTGIGDFDQGFIERSGNKMIIAGDDALGELTGIDDPMGAPLSFDDNWRTITSGYGANVAGTGTEPEYFRYTLPDQIDMPYPDPIDDMSCECCRDAIAQAATYTAQTSETWTAAPGGNPFNPSGGADVYIRDELRIPAGVTITIEDMNFYFDEDARVVVEKGNETEPGGHLILNNETLFSLNKACSDRTYTNCQEGDDCDPLTWEGVRVLGDPTKDQDISGGVQGRFTMKGNSTIEYAFVGVKAGSITGLGEGGGILDMVESNMKDNISGVAFNAYVRTVSTNETFNRSSIRFMNFDRTLDHIPADSKLTHVFVRDCSTIRLRGNTYTNSAWASYTLEFRGTGIKSNDSSIDEKWICATSTIETCPDRIRSNFSNLYKAIDASDVNTDRAVSAGFGIYDNNYIGIQAAGLLSPMFLDNEFAVINKTNASGIKLISCDQYAVENNFFTAVSTNPVWMFGVTVQSSGPGNNEIYRNRFEDITIGIVSSGTNADIGDFANDPNDCGSVYNKGLRYLCNRFDQTIPYADIYLYSGNISDDQGECDPTVMPARNIFSHSSAGIDFRVRLAGDPTDPDYPTNLELCNVPFDIEYDYSELPSSPSAIQARLEPVTFTMGWVSPNMCNTPPGQYLPTANDCPVKNTSLDDRDDVMGILGSKSNEINLDDYAVMAQMLYSEGKSGSDEDNSSSFALAEYEFWTSLTRAYQWDTLGAFPPQAVFDLLDEYEPGATGHRFTAVLADKLDMETPDWVSPSAVVNSYVIGLPSLNEEGELPLIINDVIEEEDLNSVSFVAALSELYAANDQSLGTIIPIPDELDLPTSFDEEDSKSRNDNEVDGANILVQPNPFNDVFTLLIESDQEFSYVNVIVHDILGRQLMNKVYGQSPMIEIDGSEFPNGVLIYSILLDGKLLDTGRIVKAE